jgi:hypothetical protein
MSRLTRRALLRTIGAAAGVATFGILTRRGDAAGGWAQAQTDRKAREARNVDANRR